MRVMQVDVDATCSYPHLKSLATPFEWSHTLFAIGDHYFESMKVKPDTTVSMPASAMPGYFPPVVPRMEHDILVGFPSGYPGNMWHKRLVQQYVAQCETLYPNIGHVLRVIVLTCLSVDRRFIKFQSIKTMMGRSKKVVWCQVPLDQALGYTLRILQPLLLSGMVIRQCPQVLSYTDAAITSDDDSHPQSGSNNAPSAAKQVPTSSADVETEDSSTWCQSQEHPSPSTQEVQLSSSSSQEAPSHRHQDSQKACVLDLSQFDDADLEERPSSTQNVCDDTSCSESSCSSAVLLQDKQGASPTLTLVSFHEWESKEGGLLQSEKEDMNEHGENYSQVGEYEKAN